MRYKGRYIKYFSGEMPERDLFENVGKDKRTILKRIFEK
jgi:hypothetical protein